MSELVKTVLENEKKLSQIAEERKQIEHTAKTETWNIKYTEYDPKIRAIEKERDQKIAEVESRRTQQIAVKDSEAKTLIEPIHKLERILNFVKLSNEEVKAIEPENVIVRTGTPKTKIDLGFLHNDFSLSLRLFIVSNDKKVNRYSLIVLGNNRFETRDNDFGIKRAVDWKPEHWQNAAYVQNGSAKVDYTLKTAQSPEELKTWLDRNRDKILKEYIAEYKTVLQEYLDIIAKYSLKDFDRVLAIYCTSCNWFYSIFDAVNARYIEEMQTCPRCNSQTLTKTGLLPIY